MCTSVIITFSPIKPPKKVNLSYFERIFNQKPLVEPKTPPGGHFRKCGMFCHLISPYPHQNYKNTFITFVMTSTEKKQIDKRIDEHTQTLPGRDNKYKQSPITQQVLQKNKKHKLKIHKIVGKCLYRFRRIKHNCLPNQIANYIHMIT